ncbi:cytochrome d ubiquinol oxidase subunit II [Paraburkholderia sp. UCT2]|nr:cytochrome d ubiquinol oxidase subunit II [Paraburkholderia sp. UCT2]
MLTGLIMRGVAIEFSHKAERSRWVWDVMLFAGSLLAAFMQGVSVGTYAQGIPVMNLRYTGSRLEWCDAFPLWCGVALSLGYATLGAGRLVLKGDRTLQEFGRAAARRLMPLVIVAAASVGRNPLDAQREHLGLPRGLLRRFALAYESDAELRISESFRPQGRDGNRSDAGHSFFGASRRFE